MIYEFNTVKAAFIASSDAYNAADSSAKKQLLAERIAAEKRMIEVGREVARLINAGEIPPSSAFGDSDYLPGQVVTELRPGQFHPDIGVSYGPFDNGSLVYQGSLIGTKGARIIREVIFDGYTFQLRERISGDFTRGMMRNGRFTPDSRRTHAGP
jgi:hypothetical protein